MRIYKVEQISWNKSELTDFCLPRTIAYVKTRELADRAVARDIKFHSIAVNEEDRTTEDDYDIEPIEVID